MGNIQERRHFTIGEEATLTKVITDDDILMYSRITGDLNPVHVNEKYAKGTGFGGRIAQGMLVAGFISSLLGTVLPGPGSIYMSQQLRFLAPVRPGDHVTARVKVTDWAPKKGVIKLLTEVINQDNITVITGTAHLSIPS